MKYFSLSPEVAGGLGKQTVMTRTHPPVVTTLHYQFDGWLGDDLLTSFPCYIVTRRLAKRLQEAALRGYELGAVEITRSDLFEELHPDRKLPEFVWLKITGTAGFDDFGMSSDHHLVVSGRVLRLLEDLSLNHCDVTPFPA